MQTKSILITVDLEDWFQVENLKNCIGFSQWNSKELRFEKNTRILLEIFEKYKIRTTFFVLGWNAEHAPDLIKEIHLAGHEIASHGYKHELCSFMSYEELREDILKSKAILEDITGHEITGYRAPSFSINDRTLRLLKELGFTYDSSYNSFGFNQRYGKLTIKDFECRDHAYRDPFGFWELPVSNLRIGGVTFPWGGGGYFRFLNSKIFHAGVSKILDHERGYVFYIHPWEIDYEQPRIPNVQLFFKFRHYLNLNRCQKKLVDFLTVFRSCKFKTCSQYLKELGD